MKVENLISEGLLRECKVGRIDEKCDLSLPLVVVNPRKGEIEIATPQRVSLVLWHDDAKESALTIRLAPHTQLSLTEVYASQKYASVAIEQGEGSECRVTTVMLRGAHTAYEILLNAPHSSFVMNAAVVATGFDHAALSLVTRHNVSDCKSDSTVKSVASGRAVAEFKGLVYVAQDAQRTDAKQLNRNVELGGGRVVSEPQLEIYADDVKCSHGSTVGQLDNEAIYYMRQRGISQESAERLMLEGFVDDVVAKCDIEALREMLTDELSKRLNEK
ncbi:MAG: SufD family Fe-S cluster assembly protein [Alistipes sp.]|nr:SufD family Fe-S cluster assembly protein [Alistipes sp.]